MYTVRVEEWNNLLSFGINDIWVTMDMIYILKDFIFNKQSSGTVFRMNL